MSEQEIDKIETGDVMDALIAALMESKPEAVSAKALREREQMTQWYSTHDAYSPGNWWRAEIGTDHNKDEAGIFRIERDNAPVVWRHARNPSEDIADAWEVIEKLAADKYLVQVENEDGEWHCLIGGVWANAESEPLAICRAALKLSADAGKGE